MIKNNKNLGGSNLDVGRESNLELLHPSLKKGTNSNKNSNMELD